jgi:hypothetical protein
MKTAWAYAKSAEDILAFVEKMAEQAEYYTKKEKGELKDKLRNI